MESLLKHISLSILIFLSTNSIGQNVKFELSIPLLSYHTDNISDISSGFNTQYTNGFIPQFRFTAKYKRIIGGFEHYYYGSFSGIKEHVEGKINSLRVKSFSMLLGYELYNSPSFSIRMGSGITYHKPNLAVYYDQEIHVWGGTICYEDNELGALFWVSFSKQIFKQWNVGLNLRYNPMFNEFGSNYTSDCAIPHEHDRYNYFITQLMVGYEF